MTSNSRTDPGFSHRAFSPGQLLELLSYALIETPPTSVWPMTAADWTAQGTDSSAVVQLAGISKTAPDHIIHAALQRLLSEAGLPLPGDEASRFAQADLVAQIGARAPELREQCCKLLDANYRKNYSDRYQAALEALVLIGSNWNEQCASELRESVAEAFDAYLGSDQRKQALQSYAGSGGC